MAIFSGDIPARCCACRARRPVAAYTDEAYLLTKSGQAELALGVGAGVLGAGRHLRRAGADRGRAGAGRGGAQVQQLRVLLARDAGLHLRHLHRRQRPLKGPGVAAARAADRCVGLENPAGVPALHLRQRRADGRHPADPADDRHVRDQRGAALRRRARQAGDGLVDRPFGNVFAGMWGCARSTRCSCCAARRWARWWALPGAGADIAAWMSYAMSKRFSKEPEKFGTGHVEGIVESGAANNSALGGAWIPALVFGIPGDSITAIAIGVLYLKNMNPGPTLFVDNPQNIYAVFIVFILAQLLMLPLRLDGDQGRQADPAHPGAAC
jgi:putative tricarboxylic transport membrane protein